MSWYRVQAPIYYSVPQSTAAAKVKKPKPKSSKPKERQPRVQPIQSGVCAACSSTWPSGVENNVSVKTWRLVGAHNKVPVYLGDDPEEQTPLDPREFKVCNRCYQSGNHTFHIRRDGKLHARSRKGSWTDLKKKKAVKRDASPVRKRPRKEPQPLITIQNIVHAPTPVPVQQPTQVEEIFPLVPLQHLLGDDDDQQFPGSQVCGDHLEFFNDTSDGLDHDGFGMELGRPISPFDESFGTSNLQESFYDIPNIEPSDNPTVAAAHTAVAAFREMHAPPPPIDQNGPREQSPFDFARDYSKPLELWFAYQEELNRQSDRFCPPPDVAKVNKVMEKMLEVFQLVIAPNFMQLRCAKALQNLAFLNQHANTNQNPLQAQILAVIYAVTHELVRLLKMNQ